MIKHKQQPVPDMLTIISRYLEQVRQQIRQEEVGKK